jgi:hypothetical protein
LLIVELGLRVKKWSELALQASLGRAGEDNQLRAMLEAGMVMLLLMESNGQLTKPFPQAEKFRDAA